MNKEDLEFLRKNFNKISIIQNDNQFLKISILDYEVGDTFDDYLTEDLNLDYLLDAKSVWTFIFHEPTIELKNKILKGIKDLDPSA